MIFVIVNFFTHLKDVWFYLCLLFSVILTDVIVMLLSLLLSAICKNILVYDICYVLCLYISFIFYLHAPLVCVFPRCWISWVCVSLIIMRVRCDCSRFYTFTGGVYAAICHKVSVMSWIWGCMCRWICQLYVSYPYWFCKYNIFPMCLNVCLSFLSLRYP
jgi:hypothetical protein